MHFEKINDNEIHVFEWESDQSEYAIRAILICEDPGIGYKFDTEDCGSVLDSYELRQIADKIDELNGALNVKPE